MLDVGIVYTELAIKLEYFACLILDKIEDLRLSYLSALRCLTKLCKARVKRLHRILGVLKIELGTAQSLLRRRNIGTELLGIKEPETYIRFFLGIKELKGLLCLLAFLFKRADLCRNLGKDVVDTNHIVLGLLELSLGLGLFVPELRDSRRVFENVTSFLALSRYHIGNSTLSDYRITVTSDTRIQKELINVTQANRAAIYIILTLARSEIASCYRYLVVRAIKTRGAAGVVKGHRYLGVSHRLTAVCTAKDNVLHLGRTQSL